MRQHRLKVPGVVGGRLMPKTPRFTTSIDNTAYSRNQTNAGLSHSMCNLKLCSDFFNSMQVLPQARPLCGAQPRVGVSGSTSLVHRSLLPGMLNAVIATDLLQHPECCSCDTALSVTCSAPPDQACGRGPHTYQTRNARPAAQETKKEGVRKP